MRNECRSEMTGRLRSGNTSHRKGWYAIAVIGVVALVLSMATCQTIPASANPSARTPQASRYTPVFGRVSCPLGVPSDPRVECGVLTVPEDRSRPGGTQVHLPVAIVRSTAATRAPDPIVYLAGGPGSFGLQMAGVVLASDLGGPRDVIVFDQRGAGLSIPSLACPEFGEAIWAEFATADPPALEQPRFNAAVRRCQARLRARGIDLNSFNTITNAADVGDLRVALGVRNWNLWGVSYGTTLALEVMRDFPAGVRSAVLDSVAPPSVVRSRSWAVRNAMDSIRYVLARCAASSLCAAAHPTLGRDLGEVVAALDAHPYRSVVTEPNTGQLRPIAITGRDVLGALSSIPSNPSLVPLFPQLISQLKAGQYGSIDVLATQLIPGLLPGSPGLSLSVTCAAGAQMDRPQELGRLLAAHPEYGSVVTGLNAACPAWPVRIVPSRFYRPVATAIPALILAGEWDRTTPVKQARQAAQHLSRSFFVQFPGLGHVVSFNPCAQSVLKAFMAQPSAAPGTACVRQLPEPTLN